MGRHSSPHIAMVTGAALLRFLWELSRLEQWARISVVGVEHMFLWDGAKLSAIEEHQTEWIEDSIRVFDGDFTDPNDRVKIVDTCL